VWKMIHKKWMNFFQNKPAETTTYLFVRVAQTTASI